jgi:hypothetical protein
MYSVFIRQNSFLSQYRRELLDVKRGEAWLLMQFGAKYLTTEPCAVARDPGGNSAVRSAMLLNTQFLEGSRATALGSVPDCVSAQIIKLHQHGGVVKGRSQAAGVSRHLHLFLPRTLESQAANPAFLTQTIGGLPRSRQPSRNRASYFYCASQ